MNDRDFHCLHSKTFCPENKGSQLLSEEGKEKGKENKKAHKGNPLWANNFRLNLFDGQKTTGLVAGIAVDA